MPRNAGRVLAFAVLFLALCSCSESRQTLKGGPYYFASWVGYGVPLRPVDQISLEKAKSLRSFYEAYFDDEGNLISFTKHLDGEVEWVDTYHYDQRRLIARKMTKANGEVVEQRFD